MCRKQSLCKYQENLASIFRLKFQDILDYYKIIDLTSFLNFSKLLNDRIFRSFKTIAYLKEVVF